MEAASVQRIRGTRLRLALAIVCGWTLVVAFSLVWNVLRFRASAVELARTEARAVFTKDLLYRLWATSHGGVYVPVTEKTPPNPYLAHVPERDIVTPSGRRLTLMNPAYMTRQTNELEQARFGLRGHITSLNPIRPGNKADEWETRALQALAAGEREVTEVVDLDGKSHLRLMRPLVTEEGCLKCHAAQGYKVGDIRGGMSVAVPMEPYQESAWSHLVRAAAAHGGFWALGLAGLVLAMRVVGKREARLVAAAELLQRQAGDFAAIFDSSPSIIWYLDRDHRVARTNATAAKLLGRPMEDFPGKTLHDLFPRELAERYHADNEEVMRTGRPKLGIVEPYQTSGGETRWALTDKFPSRGAGGEVTGVIIFVVDITEQRRVEDQLRSREAALSHAQRLARLGAWEIEFLRWPAGPDDEIHRWSDEAIRILGEDPATFRPSRENVFSRVHPDDREALWKAIERAVTTDSYYSISHRILWPDGSIRHLREYAEVSVLPDGRIVMFGTSQDVTDQRRLEAQLHQAQRLESLGRLAGGVAHDFNNLLTVIIGYGDLALAKLGAGDPLRAAVAEMRHAGERARELTQQLLTFSRRQVVEPKVLDLNALILETEKMLRRLIGERVQIVKSLDPSLGQVRIDPGQIQQALLNLVVNASDAMPGGGRLAIETANREIDEGGAAGAVGAKAGSFLMLAVSDSGIGMDEATKLQVFEPFFTTKEPGKGTGLGLALVRGIVEQAGGWISVESEPGKGATFRIFLPRETGSGETDTVAVLSESELPRGEETVLIAEDVAEVRRFAAEVLSSCGYHVLEAADGPEALNVCAKHGGKIDLLLADVVMPAMGGVELARRLLETNPDIRVVYMSGYAQGGEAKDSGAAVRGANFLSKPFTPSQLTAKVREALGQPHPVEVLVVDDEEAVRRLLRAAVEEAGYAVLEAADGNEALAMARQKRPGVVVIDLVMPEREGIETIRDLRREQPGLKIVAISGAFGGSMLKVALSLGADEALPKPIQTDVLLATIRRLAG